MPRHDLERVLADDPYNERRIFVLSCLHDAIYYLRHGPHRRNDVISTLEEEIAGEIDISISSAVVERDPQFERLCRNLELVIPISIRILRKHNDRETDQDVADDLISCIPTVLQQPAQWDPDVEEISDEEEFERQNSRRRHR
ncbi:hypothetical protein DTO013E5_7412 [Penicillium roqueforti]|uniref:Uncharacterized protein n=1 Tax=Penicillium roqueforti (strain FM164) TaxID=1365484 RepID=W6QAS0_PENRF|nr:uncharacterized protein LCP9604111_5093 [Penicillium roqueforti]CDM33560.1 hypothetical protein PROQFM164_S03g000284 [Penicillium roqueforti FM164]KAF9248854.1 hypothetical protein LCP9604111_5093 [Penicillium roqueforti]KAI1831732.1 hypothetical protein CBS147337_7542 [Penicillium roqueforti]KAI2681589.1 hypothetical protein CBS147355_2799 [Penicillium roqueforti]KAI2688977.1 hypothetical protein LCP963914a_2066 [Penicillium roqueforti]